MHLKDPGGPLANQHVVGHRRSFCRSFEADEPRGRQADEFGHLGDRGVEVEVVLDVVEDGLDSRVHIFLPLIISPAQGMLAGKYVGAMLMLARRPLKEAFHKDAKLLVSNRMHYYVA